jgi:hypothetical protein
MEGCRSLKQEGQVERSARNGIHGADPADRNAEALCQCATLFGPLDVGAEGGESANRVCQFC